MEYPYNLDLHKRVVIETKKTDWLPSPSSGVERIMLEREAAESGRTTSLVRYAPNTFFNEHSHGLGEEIFVLAGEFMDNHGVYPEGSYIRNPPGSKHTPGSAKGCVLFVKLGHFDPADNETIRIDTTKKDRIPGHGGLRVMSLHQFKTQGTALVKWPAGERFVPHRHWGGEEIFVLTGEFIDEYGRYPAGTWIRSPHLSTHHPYVEQETIILVKTGHLM